VGDACPTCDCSYELAESLSKLGLSDEACAHLMAIEREVRKSYAERLAREKARADAAEVRAREADARMRGALRAESEALARADAAERELASRLEQDATPCPACDMAAPMNEALVAVENTLDAAGVTYDDGEKYDAAGATSPTPGRVAVLAAKLTAADARADAAVEATVRALLQQEYAEKRADAAEREREEMALQHGAYEAACRRAHAAEARTIEALEDAALLRQQRADAWLALGDYADRACAAERAIDAGEVWRERMSTDLIEIGHIMAAAGIPLEADEHQRVAKLRAQRDAIAAAARAVVAKRQCGRCKGTGFVGDGVPDGVCNGGMLHVIGPTDDAEVRALVAALEEAGL